MNNSPISREELIKLLVLSREVQDNPTPENIRLFNEKLEYVKQLEKPHLSYQDKPFVKYSTAKSLFSIRKLFYDLAIASFTIVSLVLLILLITNSRNNNQDNKTSSIPVPTEDGNISNDSDLEDSLCGQNIDIFESSGTYGMFQRNLGVTSYDMSNTPSIITRNSVRSIKIVDSGLWFGYQQFEDIGQSPFRLSHYDMNQWTICQSEDFIIKQTVNDIEVAANGDIWIGTDGFGVFVLSEEGVKNFNKNDGLPDNRVYDIVFDNQENVWVATYEGVGKYDGSDWLTPYDVTTEDTIVSNQVSTIAFHPSGEIWVGYLSEGISRFTNDGQWLHYSVKDTPEALLNNAVRDIIFDFEGNVWIATDQGGVSKFEYKTQQWNLEIGSMLPNGNVKDLAIDKYGRVWVAIRDEVLYFTGEQWEVYTDIDALTIEFGPNCSDCPFNDEHVWLGTSNLGLTHSRIPQPSKVIEVESVIYPTEVSPGTTFNPRITVRVLPGYELKEGDGLFYAEVDDNDLFGAYERIVVSRVVSAGQSYEFVEYSEDNWFIAPEVPGTYTSIWRVWASGRYVGNEVEITFTVTE